MGPCNSNTKNNKKEPSVNGGNINTQVNTHPPSERHVMCTNVESSDYNTVRESNITKIRPSKQPIKELELLKKAHPFLPHIYNSLSLDEIKFYKTVLEVKKSSQPLEKTIFNLDDLKFYLGEFSQDSEEIRNLKLAWRLFKWITKNIKYENVSRDEDYEAISIESIFNNKSASSYAISKLVNMVFSHFDINSTIIHGYLKGSHYRRGNEINQISHEWIGVKLSNQYRLIDFSSACQNSPYYSDKEELLKYNDFFFCSLPQHLIYTHFPKKLEHTYLSQGNALLDKSVFERLPLFKMNYFIYGFQLFDFKNGEIDFEDILQRNSSDSQYLNEIIFSFALPEAIEPKLLLKNNSTSESDSSKLFLLKKRKFSKETDNKKISMMDYYFYYEEFVSKCNKSESMTKLIELLRVYEVTLRVPKKGNYELQVSAGIPTQMLTSVLPNTEYCYSYYINANLDSMKELDIKQSLFPQTSEIFLAKGCSITEPLFYHLHGYFERNKNINFTIRIPNSTSAAIFYDSQDEFVLMNKKEEYLWTFTHNVQKSFQNLVIAASFDEGLQYSILVTYSL